MRTDPEGLGTTTIAAHHCVGSSTREITPSFSIRCISCLTFSRSGSATFLGVNRQNGLASGFNLIVYSPLNVPSPEKSVGYCSGILVMEFIPVMISSALIAGNPNRLFCKLCITNTLSKLDLPL